MLTDGGHHEVILERASRQPPAARSLAILFALVAWAFSTPVRVGEPSGDEASREAILEPVYRYQFFHDASARKSAAGVSHLTTVRGVWPITAGQMPMDFITR